MKRRPKQRCRWPSISVSATTDRLAWRVSDATNCFSDGGRYVHRFHRGAQCRLLCELFGNPFHPVALDPAWLAWNGGTVAKQAAAAYTERELPSGHLDQGHLAVLADALEDAGCNEAELLGHLRSAGPHVKGCWAVDAVLGKP